MTRFPGSRTWLAAASVCALVAACGADERRSVVTDRGTLCVGSNTDGALSVNVVFAECLSSSCDTLREQTCAVSHSGDEIRVTSRIVIDREQGDCTTDCGIAMAECQGGPIDPGDYDLVFGTQSTRVTLPLEPGTRIFDAMDALGGCQ